MKANREQRAAGRIEGCVLKLREGHEVAIYLRDGAASIAEFRDGAAELCAPGAWMSVNGRGLVGAQRRGEIEAGAPISAAMAERIERLHRGAEQARRGAIVRELARIFGLTPAGSADSAA